MKQFCKYGHELTTENKLANGRCRKCKQENYIKNARKKGIKERKIGNRVDVYCHYCGNKFNILVCQTGRGRGKFCSKKCADAFRILPLSICLNCNKKIIRGHKFCSSECRRDFNYNKNIVECRICKKKFHSTSQIKSKNRIDGRQIYCSTDCWAIGHRKYDFNKYKSLAEQQKIELPDQFIKNLLRHNHKIQTITPELIELKRQGILMFRTLKEFKKWRKENESDYTDVYGK